MPILILQGALKEMFPKCCGADIPSNSAKKGTPFGFVQFSNPGDAKSAFDAAKGDLNFENNLVLYKDDLNIWEKGLKIKILLVFYLNVAAFKNRLRF